MKRFVIIFITFILCLGAGSLSVFAEPGESWVDPEGNGTEEKPYASGTIGGIEWRLNTSGVLTLSGNGVMADFAEDFAEGWHVYKEEIVAVEILDGVENLGAFSFSGLKNVSKITVPASVTDIGNGAFAGCDALAVVAVNANNPSYSSVDGVLYNKQGDTLVCCPGGIIGNVYVIKDNVKKVGAYAFYGSGTLESVEIASGVTEVGEGAFGGCLNLRAVTVADTVDVIGKSAFERCVFLSELKMPSTLSTLGDKAFWGCVSLGAVDLPEGLAAIGESVFGRCDALSTVSVPDGVERIGKSAFANCKNLAEVTLPGSVDVIEYNAFMGCAALKKVIYHGSELGFDMIDIEAGNDPLLNAELSAGMSPLPFVVGGLFILGFAAVLLLAVKREKAGSKKKK